MKQLLFTGDPASIEMFYEQCADKPKLEIAFRYKARGMSERDRQRLKDELRKGDLSGCGCICIQLTCKDMPNGGTTDNLLKLNFLAPAIKILEEQKFSSYVIVL